jgi:hypothetical protein
MFIKSTLDYISPVFNVNHQVGSAVISTLGVALTVIDTSIASKKTGFDAVVFAVSAFVSGIFTAMAFLIAKVELEQKKDFNLLLSIHGFFFSVPAFILTSSYSYLSKLTPLTHSFFFNSVNAGIRTGSILANFLVQGYSSYEEYSQLLAKKNLSSGYLTPPSKTNPSRSQSDYQKKISPKNIFQNHGQPSQRPPISQSIHDLQAQIGTQPILVDLNRSEAPLVLPQRISSEKTTILPISSEMSSRNQSYAKWGSNSQPINEVYADDSNNNSPTHLPATFINTYKSEQR